MSTAFLHNVRSKTSSEPSGEPIAYLYGDVQLPPLPEWNRTLYPYAVIYYSYSVLTGGMYVFYAIENPWVIMQNSSGDYKLVPSVNSAGQNCSIKTTATEWSELKDSTRDVTAGTNPPKWCNYNVNYKDNVADVGGTIYLAASDPIPVYE